MNVALISCFRNAESYLYPRYINQVSQLDEELELKGHTLFSIWGEGDSTDNTREELLDLVSTCNAVFVDCTHGGIKDYQGVINEQRFRELGYVGRCMWQHIPQDADAVVYVESDLIWRPETILHLIDRLQDYPAISPMVYLRRKGWGDNAFYDTWAYRKNGIRFDHYPPYVTGFDESKPFTVDSAGSCMAMRGELARGLIWDENVFIGISRQLYDNHASVWCDPGLAIYHA